MLLRETWNSLPFDFPMKTFICSTSFDVSVKNSCAVTHLKWLWIFCQIGWSAGTAVRSYGLLHRKAVFLYTNTFSKCFRRKTTNSIGAVFNRTEFSVKSLILVAYYGRNRWNSIFFPPNCYEPWISFQSVPREYRDITKQPGDQNLKYDSTWRINAIII